MTNALYLDLMKKCLTNFIYGAAETPPFSPEQRRNGCDWPPWAHTMVGLQRLDNIQTCAEDVLATGVPGDFIETGVWRGGASIFFRAVLKAHGVTDRTVWVCDSFEGLPAPDAVAYPMDAGWDWLSKTPILAVSLETVQQNFDAYGLLDEQVRFAKGWFRDTLPTLPIERIAVLRLDGDLYESTRIALDSLYPKISPGGHVIVDDYGAIPACRQAVDDFRREHAIDVPMGSIDAMGAVSWKVEVQP